MSNDSTTHILGISRSHRFSPNSVARDNAIFEAVTERLRSEGWHVDTCSEDDFDGTRGADVVFSMARSIDVLQALAVAEQQGTRVVNSAQALLAATRLRLFTLLEQAGVDVPRFWRYEGGNTPSAPFPFWMKRSADCAQSAGDVRFIEDDEALRQAADYFRKQGLDEVFCCEHLEGDLIKFYGVESTDFFHAYYPTAEGDFSKFGLEVVNGAPTGYPCDFAQLKTMADRAATASGIVVYGGDAVVASDGTVRIIDFNDWPSFSRCCTVAAQAIAEKIAGEPSSKNI